MAALFPGAGIQIRPVATFNRRIIAVHHFPGRNYRTARATRAILAICYPDNRRLSHRLDRDAIAIGFDVLLRALATRIGLPLASP